jgi:hypothetical protein
MNKAIVALVLFIIAVNVILFATGVLSPKCIFADDVWGCSAVINELEK